MIVALNHMARYFIPATIMLCVSLAFPATFEVHNVSEFQTALNTAAANGESDSIYVVAGTYNIAATLTFNSSENYAVTIAGAGIGGTILDGQLAQQPLNMLTTGSSGNVTIFGMTFRNGVSSGNGGGLFVETSYGAIAVSNCEFNDDSADVMGGGASLVSNEGIVSIFNCAFRRNEAEGAGGLNAATTTGNVALTNSLFEDNIALGNETFYGDDGAGHILYTEGGGTLLIRGCTYNRNMGEDGGGGAFAYSNGTGTTITIDSNFCNNNYAELDGAGCFVRVNVSGTVNITRNHFFENFADSGGGAGVQVHLNEGTINYRRNIHDGDSTSESGGGALIWLTSGTLNADSNEFINCYAGVNGGAISFATETASANFRRNITSRNFAGGVGGAASIATTSGSMNISNNTSYADTASEGGAMYIYLDQPTASASVQNNILWHDSAPAFSASGAATVVAQYSDIESGTGEPWFGIGCIESDPLFANPAAGELNITWANYPVNDGTKSPCIDTGNPSSPNDPDSTRADMGARHFNQATRIRDNDDNSRRHMSLRCAGTSSGKANIEYYVATPSHISLRVFDIGGRLVQTLRDGRESAGEHAIIWDNANMPCGIYFCTLTANGKTIGAKILSLR